MILSHFIGTWENRRLKGFFSWSIRLLFIDVLISWHSFHVHWSKYSSKIFCLRISAWPLICFIKRTNINWDNRWFKDLLISWNSMNLIEMIPWISFNIIYNHQKSKKILAIYMWLMPLSEKPSDWFD